MQDSVRVCGNVLKKRCYTAGAEKPSETTISCFNRELEGIIRALFSDYTAAECIILQGFHPVMPKRGSKISLHKNNHTDGISSRIDLRSFP